MISGSPGGGLGRAFFGHLDGHQALDDHRCHVGRQELGPLRQVGRSLSGIDWLSARWLMFTCNFSGITEAGQAISDLVDVLHHHAPFPHAGGLAAKLDRHADLDDLVLRNAREIDVDDVRPPGVPLQVADKGRFVDRAGKADQAAAVSDGRRQGVGRHGHRHALQAVAVQNRRHLARLPKPAVAVLALPLTRLNS